jgi:hypothetical protein
MQLRRGGPLSSGSGAALTRVDSDARSSVATSRAMVVVVK